MSLILQQMNPVHGAAQPPAPEPLSPALLEPNRRWPRPIRGWTNTTFKENTDVS